MLSLQPRASLQLRARACSNFPQSTGLGRETYFSSRLTTLKKLKIIPESHRRGRIPTGNNSKGSPGTGFHRRSPLPQEGGLLLERAMKKKSGATLLGRKKPSKGRWCGSNRKRTIPRHPEVALSSVPAHPPTSFAFTTPPLRSCQKAAANCPTRP